MGLDSMSCGSFSGGAGGGEVLRENERSICTAEPFHCSPETVTALFISHVLSGLSCPTLCNPMDCSPPDSSVSGDSPGKNTGVGCHALLQRLFPTHGLNPGLPDCEWILYCLESSGKPENTGAGSLSLLQGILPTQESNQGLPHCRWILYQLSY